MWYSLQTVTTVGYGDITPTALGGRLVGVLLMLQGTAFIAIVTAAITSTFVARAQKASEAERAGEELSDRQGIDKRFDELERKLDLIAAARDEPGS
jgi:voltage-gated potassium channel Kch